MKAQGFFGNWAKYNMENPYMHISDKIKYAIKHPDVYSKSQLLLIMKEAKEYYIDKDAPTDPIYDESGFQVGTASPVVNQIPDSDYFTCRANSIYELEHQVNNMVKVGYKPVGGLYVVDGVFYQAVFLDIPKEKQQASQYTVNLDLKNMYKDYLHF